MDTKEIIEGNKLIAKFMGFIGMTLEEYANFEEQGENDNVYWIDYALYSDNYNSSWSRLMPVAEKIFRTKIGDGIEYIEYSYARTFGMLNREDGQIMVRFEGGQLQQSDTLLEATYKAVINFIQWYNSKQ